MGRNNSLHLNKYTKHYWTIAWKKQNNTCKECKVINKLDTALNNITIIYYGNFLLLCKKKVFCVQIKCSSQQNKELKLNRAELWLHCHPNWFFWIKELDSFLDTVLCVFCNVPKLWCTQYHIYANTCECKISLCHTLHSENSWVLPFCDFLICFQMADAQTHTLYLFLFDLGVTAGQI